jgi:hypothetical protein
MRGIKRSLPNVCTRCLRVGSAVPKVQRRNARYASGATKPVPEDGEIESDKPGQEKEVGAMTKRLSEMSEESLESGGRRAAKAVEEAGFSEELKRALEERIARANFVNKNPQALAQASLPASTGKEARDIAGASPWSGSESVEDATLRMLTDARKPIRATPKLPGRKGPPKKVDTGRPAKKSSGVATGSRLANARDKSSMYEFSKDAALSESERDKLRQEMKQRFSPTARSIPATIRGLEGLANERIEDAIASGKFKNLPRGKKIERDYNASSPFINTTEYLMNKIIQKQEIVPPWIEKQQELVTTAMRFRSRLRNDWRRHVARVISSRGGNLERQLQLADEYAFAESIENPPKKKEVKLNAVDNSGHLSQITLAGELKVAVPEPTQSVQEEETALEEEIKVMEQTFNDDGTLKSQPDETIIVSTTQPQQSLPADQPYTTSPRTPTVPPFRDPQWLETERAYLKVAIDNLNSIARSYNLMAPSIARKPYYDLERELKACFADVAPQVAGAIRERAFAPKIRGIEVRFWRFWSLYRWPKLIAPKQVVGHKPGGVLEKFSTDTASYVHDDQKPQYGFKEFWRDLFAGSKT